MPYSRRKKGGALYGIHFTCSITDTGTRVTAFELTRPTSKRRWTPRRFVADSAEFVLFLLMVFLPGIDLGFRFKALFTILVIRLAVAGLFAVLYRKNDKTKKRSAIVL